MKSKLDQQDSFWEKYHDLRRRKLPAGDEVYRFSEKFYQTERQQLQQEWASVWDKKLPARTIDFYNSAFELTHDTVIELFQSSRVSSRVRALVTKAYAVRLGRKATFADLCALDIFAEKTICQDINPASAFGDILAVAQMNPGFLLNTYHFFLHRAQKTEHLFLHEIIVGFLINEILNEGSIPARSELPAFSRDYLPYSAYVHARLAELMKCSNANLAALHFESSTVLNNSLSPFVKDLMLSAAHIYWYLDFFHLWAGRYTSAEMLGLLFNYYVLPLIDRELAGCRQQLKSNAAVLADGILKGELLANYPQSGDGLSDSDVIQILLGISRALWTQTKKPKRSSPSTRSLIGLERQT